MELLSKLDRLQIDKAQFNMEVKEKHEAVARISSALEMLQLHVRNKIGLREETPMTQIVSPPNYELTARAIYVSRLYFSTAKTCR
jgi:hypothetical protein